MKTIASLIAMALALAASAQACIEVTAIGAANFTTRDHPFLITFRDADGAVEVTVSYAPSPNKFGELSTIHGEYKIEVSTPQELSKWVLSKAEKDIKANFSIQAGKPFVKIFSIRKADLDKAVFSGSFSVMGHGQSYRYVLGEIFRSETANR